MLTRAMVMTYVCHRIQVGGLITGDGYKLLLGDLTQAGWTGPVPDNSVTPPLTETPPVEETAGGCFAPPRYFVPPP